jgi:hypothetical protein
MLTALADHMTRQVRCEGQSQPNEKQIKNIKKSILTSFVDYLTDNQFTNRQIMIDEQTTTINELATTFFKNEKTIKELKEERELSKRSIDFLTSDRDRYAFVRDDQINMTSDMIKIYKKIETSNVYTSEDDCECTIMAKMNFLVMNKPLKFTSKSHWINEQYKPIYGGTHQYISCKLELDRDAN